MQSGCTVFQLLLLCMSLRCPKCYRMAIRLGKSETFAFPSTVFQMRRALATMWTFILLHSAYLTVTFAQTTSPELCPGICECSKSIVNCTQRDLKRIPDNISEDVTILDLSGNKISSINNDALLQFPQLVELNLNYNDVHEVFKLGKFPKSLRCLYLKGNRIKTLSGKWDQFTKLDFSENRIARISNDTFGNSSKLNELNLSCNQITTIAFRALTDLPLLQNLRLDGNCLTSLPNLYLKALVTLDLRYNKLESIPNYQLKDMTPALQVLLLSYNKIKSFNTATFFGTKLKKMYLDSNLLTSVHMNWTFGLMELVDLHLQNNQITNISSDSWSDCCSNLKYLNLANNSLRRVLVGETKNGGRFAKLKSLVSLKLSSNRIFEIADNSFQSLQNLRSLDLSNNQLSWTTYDSNGTFRGLRKLKNLNLSSNDITSVVKVMFEQLSDLEKLDITNNRIEEVTKDSFKPIKSLRDLRMNSDWLYCSCKLTWFSQWLSTKNFSHPIVAKCRLPKKFSGRDLLDIPSKDLVCDSVSRPEITEHPKTQTALRGDEIQLSCTVKNGSIKGIQIIWKKDMKNVDTNHSEVRKYTQETLGEKSFFIYKSVLRLRNVSESHDGGLYQCVVVTRVGNIKSRKATLQVFVPPRFTRKPGDLVTTAGGDVRFNCSASGQPRPNIHFGNFDGSKMSAEQLSRLDLIGETFILRNVTVNDVGFYRCIAKSKAGVINTTFQINIFGKPVPVQRMVNKITLPHDSVMFYCGIRAWPPPKYMWFKDGKRIDLTSSNVMHRRELNAEYLVILRAERADAGAYKCLVTNELGSTELTSHLQVVEDLETTPKPTTKGIETKTFVVALVFTASSTMVVTTLICIAVFHIICRRRRGFPRKRQCQASGDALQELDAAVERDSRKDYMQITENSPGESPRSSSTFVTSSDSQTPSDSAFTQTSVSDGGSSKEIHETLCDGRHSSGVCSMHSSSSSLASAPMNHRNTYPFPKTKSSCGVTCMHSASGDVSSFTSRSHEPLQRTLMLKHKDQHRPSRRKHKSSRSRDWRANKRRKGTESEKLYGEPVDDKVVV